jgi:hypothetical protein
MIAMLLAAQLSAEIVRGMPLDAVPHPNAALVSMAAAQPLPGLVRRLPIAKGCPGAGRMEASFAEPAALYRHGDRPAVTLRKWVDFPDGRYCQVEAMR